MNKKKKILVIVTLLVIAIVGIYYFLKGNKFSIGATPDGSEPFTVNITTEMLINERNDIYSVEYEQELINDEKASVYETTALAKIRGENVTFVNYSSENKTTTGKKCIENNIMAGIISGAGVECIGYMHNGEESIHYSGEQLAIWEFWNIWVQNSGANENGFEKGMGNKNVNEDDLNGETERKKAQNKATQNNYNVNIYFLKYFTKNNGNDEATIDNQPNLILVEVLDEDEEIIEIENKVETNSNISISITNNIEGIVKVGREVIYDINIYNNNEEEQQNLTLNYTLPKGITFVSVKELVDNYETELKENEAYNYNEQTRTLKISLNKISGQTTGTRTNEELNETLEYIKPGIKNYHVTVRVEELKEDVYSQEIKNIVELYKENKILARGENTITISDACLKIEIDKLPENLIEKQNCVIGLKITNKGLVPAENVNFKISVPNEISVQNYKIITTTEDGEERIMEGTAINEFENNTIEIASNGIAYIKLTGILNEIEEGKQITIKGTINDKEIIWTTNVQKAS